MENMNPQILSERFIEWLKANNHKVVESKCVGNEVCFCSEDSREHTVFFSDLQGQSGAIAANSPYASKVLQEFMGEAIGDSVTLSASHFKVNSDSKESYDDLIRRAMSSGPSGIKEFFSKNGAELKGNITIDDVVDSYEKLKKVAELTGDEKRIEEIQKLGKLVEVAKLLNDTFEEKKAELSRGEQNYLKLKGDGRTESPCKLKRLKVGDKFFDSDYNFCVAVGFEKGKVQDQFINSVILASNTSETHEGLPVKLGLTEIVTPVKI